VKTEVARLCPCWVCTVVKSEMKDSLNHDRTFLLYEGLKGNVCLYCDALYLIMMLVLCNCDSGDPAMCDWQRWHL
jgi:hypothetical protein